MTEQRLASITMVTPNWNGRDFLEPCIESVLDQDYPALEYIVIDGASTDGSVQIIEQYQDALAHFVSEPDEGHADALNKGFALSSGEIMGWINSDDILHPGTLHFVNRLFQAHPEIAWITGRPTSMDEDDQIGWIGPARPWSRLRFLAGDCEWIQQESTFWRRSLWDAAGAGLDTRYRLANDFELWMRFFRHAELHTVDRPLGCFRIRTGQRSVVFRAGYESEADTVLQAELDGLDPDFRAAFAGLVPEKARRLSPAECAAMDARLAICDPPTLRRRASHQPGATGSAPPEGDAASAHPALARAITSDDLASLAGSQAGNRVFIICESERTPPPHTRALLRGEMVICGPSVFLATPSPFAPTCLFALGEPDLASQAAALETQLSARPVAITVLPVWTDIPGSTSPAATRALIAPRPGHVYAETGGELAEQSGRALAMAHLAQWLGSTDIVLAGVPENYDTHHENWAGIAAALEASGGSLRIALQEDEAAPDGPLACIALDTLFDPQTRAERIRAAPGPAARWVASASRGLQRLGAAMPGRVQTAIQSAWNNRAFLAGMVVLAGAGLVITLATPDPLTRLAILGALGLGVLAAGLVAVAIKTRRLFFNLHKEISGVQQREAALEMKLLTMEIRQDSYRAARRGVDNGRDTH